MTTVVSMRIALNCIEIIVALVLLGSTCTYAAPTQLRFSATLVEASCAISLSTDTLALGTVTVNDLTPNRLLLAKPFSLTVDSCTGNPQQFGLAPKIRVTGEGVSKGKWLFRNSGSDAATAGVGVVLYNADSVPAYASPALQNGSVLNLGPIGTLPLGRTLTFHAGLSCGNACTSIQPGQVSATVLFDFIYQ